jgi:hypothetical protein
MAPLAASPKPSVSPHSHQVRHQLRELENLFIRLSRVKSIEFLWHLFESCFSSHVGSGLVLPVHAHVQSPDKDVGDCCKQKCNSLVVLIQPVVTRENVARRERAKRNSKIMTDFWKSNGRKWCDFCKCWLADNKPVSESNSPHAPHRALAYTASIHIHTVIIPRAVCTQPMTCQRDMPLPLQLTRAACPTSPLSTITTSTTDSKHTPLLTSTHSCTSIWLPRGHARTLGQLCGIASHTPCVTVVVVVVCRL